MPNSSFCSCRTNGRHLGSARKVKVFTWLADDPRVLKEPAAMVTVGALADSSVNLNVRPWVNSADYWAVYWDTLEKVKLAFDEQGIGIPFPQMDVHIKQGKQE